MDLGQSFDALPWVVMAAGGLILAWSRIRQFVSEPALLRAELQRDIREVKRDIADIQSWKLAHSQQDDSLHSEIRQKLHDIERQMERMTGKVETLGAELLGRRTSE